MSKEFRDLELKKTRGLLNNSTRMFWRARAQSNATAPRTPYGVRMPSLDGLSPSQVRWRSVVGYLAARQHGGIMGSGKLRRGKYR